MIKQWLNVNQTSEPPKLWELQVKWGKGKSDLRPGGKELASGAFSFISDLFRRIPLHPPFCPCEFLLVYIHVWKFIVLSLSTLHVFSNQFLPYWLLYILCVCVCVCVCYSLFLTPWTVASVHEILQARILEWIATPFSRGSSKPRDWTRVSCIAGRCFSIWATNDIQLWKQKLFC